MSLLFCSCADRVEVYDLKCENLTEPLAIDNIAPHLSWKIKADGDFRQTAYRILAASDTELLKTGNADLWDSGVVESSEQIMVPYGGKGLESGSLVYWKVLVYGPDRQLVQCSGPARFGVGLLHPDDWKGEYIGMASGASDSPQFRKTFEYDGKAGTVLLHLNSLGYHYAWLNGHPVSDNVLAPAVSQFDRRSLSVTYDLTPLLEKGTNELVVWIGKGWYRANMPGYTEGGPFVRAQVDALDDGIWTTVAATDGSWSVRDGGYISTGTWRPHCFGGEMVVADRLLEDFSSESLDKAEWERAVTASVPSHSVSPQMSEPNRVIREFHPVSVEAAGDSSYIYDLGTNMTGWTEVKFPALRSGDTVRLSYTDYLNPDGSFRDGLYEDYYVASGKKGEVFENRFNYQAYRYLKISGVGETPAPEDITARLVRTSYGGRSEFSCSDEDLNRIHDMVQYTLECLTLGGYMVDCPQIERLGYGGDGNASTATLQTMFDVSPLYLNWMQAWADCMREGGSMPHTAPNPYTAGGGPFWCGFMIVGSWQTYVNYNDRRLLDRYYPYMVQWMEYVRRHTVDGLLKAWPDTDYRGWYLGDWATSAGIDQMNPASVDLVNNCFIAVCYDTMAKIASVLGRNAEAEGYAASAEALKKTMHERFYQAGGMSYGTGTQIDIAYPMLAGVTPPALAEGVKNTLFTTTEVRFKGHLATGLVGVPVLTEWVTENGEADFMYGMLKKRDCPGYLYMLDNGATTTWEYWHGERSMIHNCYNGIGSWFYMALGGILPDEDCPGYRHFTICPQLVDGVSWVNVRKDTPFGEIALKWERSETSFVMDIELPVGCSASLAVPEKILGKVGPVSYDGNKIPAGSIEVPAGKHRVVYGILQ